MNSLIASLRKPKYKVSDYPPPPDIDDMAPEAATITRNVSAMIDNLHRAIHTGDKKQVQAAIRNLNLGATRLRRRSKISLYGWLAFTGLYLLLLIVAPPHTLLGVITTCIALACYGQVNWINISRWKAVGLTGGEAYFYTLTWLKTYSKTTLPAHAPDILKAIEEIILHEMLDAFIKESPTIEEYGVLALAAHYGTTPPKNPTPDEEK